MSTDNHINSIIPSLHHRINTIKSIQNVTDEKTRLQLANSIVIGKLNHALPLLTNISAYGKAKLHKILMTTARTVIGHYGFKWSCTKILNNCNWPNIDDMIKLSSLKLLHYIITNRSPTNIFNKMKIPKRNTSEITLKAIPQTRLSRNFFLYKQLKNYNCLPNQIKSLNKNKFKYHSKYFLMHNKKHPKLK